MTTRGLFDGPRIKQKVKVLSMIVILDSNIFFNHYFLKHSTFQVFLEGLVQIKAKLAIPEVVVDETVNNYRKRLQELVNKEVEAIRGLHQFLPDYAERSPAPIDVAKQVENYRTYLVETIAEYGSVLPYPEVAHKKLVSRESEGRKPFAPNGSGYRDAVIWESVTRCANQGDEKIVFITNNSSDFGEGPNVHPDMKSDLAHPDLIALYGSLKSFNEAMQLMVVTNFTGSLADIPITEVELRVWLTEKLVDVLFEYENAIQPLISGFEEGIGSVYPSRLGTLHEVNVIRVGRLSSGKLLIRVKVIADVNFSLSAGWRDYRSSERVRDVLGPQAIGVSDASWHETQKVDLILDLMTTASPSYSIESYELLAFAAEHGSVIFSDLADKPWPTL